MDDSDLSSLGSLSPPPPSDHEGPSKSFGVDGSNDDERSLTYQTSSSSEAMERSPPQRSPTPPHEYVLADNPDIAVREIRVNRVAFGALAMNLALWTAFANFWRHCNSS